MGLERTREREALIAGGGAPGEALAPRARPGCRRQSGRAEKGLPGARQAPPGDRGDTSLASAARSCTCSGAQRTLRVGGEEGARATRALSRGVIPSSWDRTHDKDN